MCAPCVHRVCTMGAPCLSKNQKISQFRTSAQKFIWKRNGAYTVHTVHTRCTDGAPHDVHTVFQHPHVNDHWREAPKEKNRGFCSVEAHKNVCALLCAFVRFCAPRFLGILGSFCALFRFLGSFLRLFNFWGHFLCAANKIFLKQATLSTGNTDMGGISGQTTKGRNARGFGPFF